MNLEITEQAASTSETLKAQAEAGAPETALMARRQTAGHGRMGRPWTSTEGNLHLSVLLRPPTLRYPGHWSILAGVALAETAASLAPVRLKWPNDLLIDGAKAAGILVEAGGLPTSPWLVIGFGVNLMQAPEGLGRPVACFKSWTNPPTADAFAKHLLATFTQWRLRYTEGGFEPIRTAWLHRGHRPNERVTAAGHTGTFQTLAEDGALVLETDNGTRMVRSGEVE